jgi:hypothetical protein
MPCQGETLGIYEIYDNTRWWSLLEYVSPAGRPAISDWRTGLKTPSRIADLDTFLRYQVKIKDWGPASLRPLKGKAWKGLHELRWKSDGVPHRIGGYFSAPDEFVMLIGFTHNSRKYDPPSALDDTILVRKRHLQTGEASLREYQIITGR